MDKALWWLLVSKAHFRLTYAFSYTSSTLEPFTRLNGHTQMVSEVDVHPITLDMMPGYPSECSALDNLVLTSSVDWSVRLWRLQDPPVKPLNVTVVQPLMTLEQWVGCIHDVKWSPTNPCVFAVGGPKAHVYIYDISAKKEDPIRVLSLGRKEPSEDAFTSLTSISWSESGDAIAASLSNSSVNLSFIDKEVMYLLVRPYCPIVILTSYRYQ